MNEEENNTVEEQENVETPDENVESQESNEDTDDNTNIDGDKTVEKLKKRLDSKTAENHDLKQKYDEQVQLLDDLKSGRKSIKELAAEDKQSKEDTEKDQEIANLKAEIAHTKAINETNAVFKEQGIVVNDDVLNMVVGTGTDNDAIFSNVKAITELINTTNESARQEFMKGRTPKITGQHTTGNVTAQEFDGMTLSQKVKLHADNPQLFNKLTGGNK